VGKEIITMQMDELFKQAVYSLGTRLRLLDLAGEAWALGSGPAPERFPRRFPRAQL